MLQVDARLDEEALKQCASQIGVLPPHVKHFMAESFVGDQTPEFYQGLCAGLAAAYQYAGTGPAGRDYIGMALSASADLLLKKQAEDTPT